MARSAEPSSLSLPLLPPPSFVAPANFCLRKLKSGAKIPDGDRVCSSIPVSTKNRNKIAVGPSPFLQSINTALHRYPLSIIFHGLYWFLVLSIVCPFAGICMVWITAFKVIITFFQRKSTITANGGGKQLAVFITGCDSGFGRDIALNLAEHGFIVFATCLTADGVRQYEDKKYIIPLRLDVTKKEQIDDVYKKVSEWLSETEPNKMRVLHAIINNAGCGSAGCIDWLNIEDIRKDMEVNFFGTVQITKALLPILKNQACHRVHTMGRIINITSMAGLVMGPNASSYHASKFAAEAFSNVLRIEMKAFNLFVTTVNPSYHKTPLVDSMGDQFERRWESIGKEKRDEYGQDFFHHVKSMSVDLPKKVMWNAEVAVNQITECVQARKPDPQLIIGSDAKYALLLMRASPVWLMDLLCGFSTFRPAIMRG